MKVKDIIPMFSMFLDLEVYPNIESEGEDFYFLENASPNEPIFKGEIKDLPYYLLECEITDTRDCCCEPIEFRAGVGSKYPGRVTAVFTVDDPDKETSS